VLAVPVAPSGDGEAVAGSADGECGPSDVASGDTDEAGDTGAREHAMTNESAPPAIEDAANAAKQGSEADPTNGSERGRLVSMTVDELQLKYFEVVGRATASEDKAYLVWKIRQAQRGKVPVGPTRRRAAEVEPSAYRVLPLRLATTTIDALDEVWRRRGIASRSEFLRSAIAAQLSAMGEDGAASVIRADDRAVNGGEGAEDAERAEDLVHGAP
jgi:hypothetical protein